MLDRLGAIAPTGTTPGARVATIPVDSGMKDLGGSLYA
jgi:hypothetical protein